MSQARVFICHASEDKAQASRVALSLQQAGCQVFYGPSSMLPGQDLKTSLSKGIDEADFFVYLLSRHSVKKAGYVPREVKTALEKALEKPFETPWIIPVRLDDCEPIPTQIKELVSVDLFPPFKWDSGLSRLMETIRTEGFELAEAPPVPGTLRVGDRDTHIFIIEGDHIKPIPADNIILSIDAEHRNNPIPIPSEFSQEVDELVPVQ